MRNATAIVVLLAATWFACKGKDESVKVVKSQFNPGLSPVPGDIPDKPPPEKIGDAWTIYGLWAATQDTAKSKLVENTEVSVKGYVVHVERPSADPFGQDITPHVWIADQPSRKGLYFPLTGYADSYVALEEAAAYDKCIEACTKAKGDPLAQAASTPGRYSRIFGDCVTDVPECRALYEDNPRANFFKLMGPVLKWYVRDQVWGSPKRMAIEEELRGSGNQICEAGPAQRRVLVSAMTAVALGFDIEQFKRTVEAEIKEKHPHERLETLDPKILQSIANKHLTVYDEPANVKTLIDRVRAMRAGTDPATDLFDSRKWGPELRGVVAKGDTDTIKSVADDLLMDLLIRWFWSKADTKIDANKACVFDDLIDFTSSFNMEPIDLLTRRRAMLGPVPGTNWEQAMESQQPFELKAKFVSQSRTGFLGWLLDVTPTMVCSVKSNCPDYLNPIFGDVYDFGFGETETP
ncbi:MAG: hypothetical protein JXB32_08330 [Deltaproteobacteria bacterium]|nr:hypothetical protein [Deltaproteobacteria bacterium]